MTDDFADRVDAARSWTEILTAVPYASSIGCTVGIDYALGPTTFVRVPVEIGQADTGGRAGDFPTHSVRTAWGRLARV